MDTQQSLYQNMTSAMESTPHPTTSVDFHEATQGVYDAFNDTFVTREPLIVTDMTMAIIYICLMSVALLVGTLGNILILIIALLYRDANKVGKEFIVNLAIADLCVSSVADPMCIIGVVKGELFFNQNPWLCHFIASLCLTACFCAFTSLTMLTINRYIYICHHDIFDKIYTKCFSVIFCIMCWALAFLFEFPNVIGWAGHVFDRKNHQCIWDRTINRSYTLFVSAGSIGVPLCVMAICYILIFRRIWESKRDIYKFETDNPMRMRKAWSETTRNCHALFILFLVFLVCWTPYAIVVAIDVGDRLSIEIHLFVTLLAHLHSSSNCTIYTIFNREFRSCVARIFGCKSNRTKSFDVDAKIKAYAIK